MGVFSYTSIDNALSHNYKAVLKFGDNTDYSFACHTVSLPQISTDPVEINVGGYKYKYPSTPNFNEISMTLFCDDDEAIIQKLYEWQTNCYSHNKISNVFPSTGLSGDGKIDTTFKNGTDFLIQMYNPTNTSDTSGLKATWHFYGAWPQQISYGERSYESAEPLSISITLAYQYANFSLNQNGNT